MKYAKIFSLIALASLLFSCGKEYPAFEYGPEDAKDKAVVYFPNTSAEEELDPVAETYELTIARADATSALSVPLTVFDPAGVFTVPATAEFAAGEETATVVIDVTKMELETPYELTISVPSDNYYFYDAESEESAKNTFHLSALKQKWIDAGTCTFFDWTFFDEVTSVDNIKIQQHEGTNDFRLVAPYNALDDEIGPANVVFTIKDNQVLFTPGLLNFFPGTGCYMYWDPDNYASYCNTDLYADEDVPGAIAVEVNFLLLDGGGSLYLGWFAFVWNDSPITLEEE